MGEAAKYRPELDLDEFERRLRAAAPSPQARQPTSGAPDPLAELARLVGGAGDRREDPFEALFRAQKAVAESGPAPQPQVPHDPYLQSAHPDAYVGVQPESHWADEPAHVDAPWAGQAPEFTPEPQAFAPQPARPAGRRRVVYVMAALLVGGVAVFAGGLALKKSSSDEVVTIQADSDPAKVKPASQDTAANGSGQALFDGKDDAAPTKAVSKTEQPADLAIAARQAQAQAKAGGAAAVATPAPPQPAAAASQPQGGDAPLMAPKKVKTVSIRADGSLLNAPESAKPRNTLPTMAAGVPGVAPIAPVAPAKAAAPRAPSTTEAALQAQPKPKAKPETKPEAKPEPAAASAASGDWAVQLAGEPSEEEARAAATRFAAKYGSALQGRHPTFVSAQVGEKTIYRVRVGRLSKEAANGMCGAIKGQGGACFIVKN